MADQEHANPELDEQVNESQAAGNEAAGGGQPGDELSLLREQLAAAQAQANDFKDQNLRLQAEIQNVRRRAERDIESAHKFGLEKFSTELLPIVDNLERALESIDPNDETLKTVSEGIELTLKQFISVLQKFDIEAIDPLGEPFDPQYHEAMAMVESPDAEPNSIIDVMQKGFTLNKRLIRAAMVVVAKPAPKVDEQA